MAHTLKQLAFQLPRQLQCFHLIVVCAPVTAGDHQIGDIHGAVGSICGPHYQKLACTHANNHSVLGIAEIEEEPGSKRTPVNCGPNLMLLECLCFSRLGQGHRIQRTWRAAHYCECELGLHRMRQGREAGLWHG